MELNVCVRCKSVADAKRLITALRRDKKIAAVQPVGPRSVRATTVEKGSGADADAYKKRLEARTGVVRAEVYADQSTGRRSRTPHVFFDIDSTLTPRGIKTLDKDVKIAFQRLREAGCRLYFCTGRAYQEVLSLMSMYQTKNQYSIAEGGGVVIGIGRTYLKLTERNERAKLMNHIRMTRQWPEDQEQSNRLTEFVIAMDKMGPEELRDAIRESGAEVDVHKSNTAYHVTERGIDKGAGIRRIQEELEINSENDVTVGVGDSDLDIPMFNECDECYVAGTDVCARNKECRRLSAPPNAMNELCDILAPFSG